MGITLCIGEFLMKILANVNNLGHSFSLYFEVLPLYIETLIKYILKLTPFYVRWSGG